MKFAALRQVLRQRLDICERALTQSRHRLQAKKDERQALFEEIFALALPNNGSSRLWGQTYAEKGIYRGMLEACDREIADLEEEVAGQEGEYRKQSLEFERIEILHQREVRALEARERERERKELDALAVLQFAQKTKENA